MTEEQFLDKYVFYGLTNRNNGFDTNTILHFTAADFNIILQRAKNCHVHILGTERWSKGRLRSVKYMEDYCDTSNWAASAFATMCAEDEEQLSLFSATYDIPIQPLAKIKITDGRVLQPA